MSNPDMYIAIYHHEYGVDVFTFYFVPDDKLKYPSPSKVAEHFNIDFEPGKCETFELAQAYGPRMETLTASQVGSETLGPADWADESEEEGREEDDEDIEPNVPCVACGRVDLPLHTNGQCGVCGPRPSTNDKLAGETEIRLPCFGITVCLDREPTADMPGGTITSDLKEPSTTDAAISYNAAIDGLESLILAHACAGIDVATPAYVEGIETAVAAIADHFGE